MVDFEWTLRSLKEHFDWALSSLKERHDDKFTQLAKALELQAKEYERRLAELNHAHDRAVTVQHTYVTQEKYDERAQSDTDARDAALLRVNEKFDEYVKRYEQRQREVDQALAIQKGAAEQAQRIAEEQGRKSNRNIAIATIVITVVMTVINFVTGDPQAPVAPP